MKTKDQVLRAFRREAKANIVKPFNAFNRGYISALNWILELSDKDYERIVAEERKKIKK